LFEFLRKDRKIAVEPKPDTPLTQAFNNTGDRIYFQLKNYYFAPVAEGGNSISNACTAESLATLCLKLQSTGNAAVNRKPRTLANDAVPPQPVYSVTILTSLLFYYFGFRINRTLCFYNGWSFA
jgi:hypothetical protein